MPLEQLLTQGQALRITRWGEPVLHRPCRAVSAFDTNLWNLLCDMFANNRAADGAGLAAPQIGVDLAVFVYDCLDANGCRRQGLVCNLRIAVHPFPGLDVEEEGCLSLPGAHLPLARPDFALCKGQDQFDQPVTVNGTGTLARCLQHETDHLNGIVMEDHLTPEERRDLRRQHAFVKSDYPRTLPADSN